MSRSVLHALHVIFVTLLLVSVTATAELRIASWNIQNLGWGEVKRFDYLTEIAQRFDLLAIQEVMNREAIERLQGELEVTTNESWGLVNSHRLGESRYKEKYAFLWREAAVEFTGEALIYIDDAERFVREPMAARFRSRSTDQRFVFSTLHAVYGNTVAERAAEAEALRSYFLWLKEVFAEGDPIIIGGDFNLAPHHPAWERLREVAFPAITEGATTVSTIEGRYANLYDNFWITRGTPFPIKESGILLVPEILDLTHEDMRRYVSDHVPVYIRLEGAPPVSDARVTIDVDPDKEPTTTGRLRGNRNSRIVHRPDCPSYDQVAKHNRVHFETKDDAKDAGYRLARNCP